MYIKYSTLEYKTNKKTGYEPVISKNDVKTHQFIIRNPMEKSKPFLKPGEWIQPAIWGGGFICSEFYATPRTVEEILEHTFWNLDSFTREPIGKLGELMLKFNRQVKERNSRLEATNEPLTAETEIPTWNQLELQIA